VKCISFSLYGNEPRYTIGAIKNAILASRYFPFDDGFIVRFYIGIESKVDESILSTLQRFKGVQISIVGEPEDHRAKLWRYYAFSDSQFEAVICRDVDARLSYRDRIAHEDWQQSGLDYHIIKDHPSGHDYAISAGMFAGKTAKLRTMEKLIQEMQPSNYYTTDQDFLASHIYPLVMDSVLIHDPYYNTPTQGKSIRTTIAFDAPTPLSHIGAALNADDSFVFDVDRKLSASDGHSEKYQYESDRWGK
jgi:protein O-GlcNAc transferase